MTGGDSFFIFPVLLCHWRADKGYAAMKFRELMNLIVRLRGGACRSTAKNLTR
jgi:hypothetical protein